MWYYRTPPHVVDALQMWYGCVLVVGCNPTRTHLPDSMRICRWGTTDEPKLAGGWGVSRRNGHFGDCLHLTDDEIHVRWNFYHPLLAPHSHPPTHLTTRIWQARWTDLKLWLAHDHVQSQRVVQCRNQTGQWHLIWPQKFWSPKIKMKKTDGKQKQT